MLVKFVKKCSVILGIFLYAGCLQSVQATVIEARGHLIQNLFAKYDVRNYPQNVVLQLGVVPIAVNLKPMESIFQTSVVFQQLWSDPRLEWNPADYGNQTALIMPSDQVWKPDIKLLNPAPVQSLTNPCTKANVVIFNNGEVHLDTQCFFEAACNLPIHIEVSNVSNSCSLKFENWDSSTQDFQIQLKSYKNQSAANLSLMEKSNNWEVINTSIKRTERISFIYGGTISQQLQFNFEIQRQKPSIILSAATNTDSNSKRNYTKANHPPISVFKLNVSPPIGCGPTARVGPDGTCQEIAKLE